MKTRLFMFILLMASISVVKAETTASFQTDYAEKGIDYAVKAALAQGITPDRIIKAALHIENLQQDLLMKALFCGLALPGSIYDAAAANRISESTVARGYTLALGECSEEMEQNLNASIGPANQPPGLSPSSTSRSSGLASPWKFE